jgi:DNA-binding MarR family transcriptional regulator
MREAMVADVRRFNRAVTAQVGALDDRFLGRSRPLGEARLLWEIGPEGCALRALRARLGLDSGYVSRLLRSLEAAGLVTVVPDGADRRARVVRLTPAGLAERATLDRRSDDLAWSLLASLTGRQQDELVAAMRKVERLLTAGSVEIRPVDPTHPDARRCLAA